MQDVGISRKHVFPELPGVYPDVHKRALDTHFGAERIGGSVDVRGVKAVYLICFTNRCGSNFLAQAMASDGSLKQAGESLNFTAVIHQSKRHGLESFSDYFSWLIKAQLSASGVMGCKASVGQLMLLHEHGILDALGPRLKAIHVCREDVLDQAVSLFIADKTKQWTSEQVAQDVEIEARPKEILVIAKRIAEQNATFKVLFRMLGISSLEVDYDRFVGDPAGGLAEISNFLEIPSLQLREERLTYKKQADARNERIKQCVLDQYRIR